MPISRMKRIRNGFAHFAMRGSCEDSAMILILAPPWIDISWVLGRECDLSQRADERCVSSVLWTRVSRMWVNGRAHCFDCAF
jgi:hypothetical protein